MPINRLVIKEEISTYASVLLDGLYQAGGQDEVLTGREQLEMVGSYIRSSIELSDALNDTGYTDSERYTLVKNLFTQVGINPILVEVLAVMAERGDMRLLPRVSEVFGGMLEAKLGITVIDVTTSVPLDSHLREVIKNKTAGDLGTSVVLNERVEPNILGGIVMSAHGKRIDASVQSQLESARSVLKTTTDGGEGK